MSHQYNFQRVGFAQGLGWLPASAEMMRRGFRPLAAIAALWLGVSLIVVIPLIGQVVLALITPLLTAGVLLAFDRLGQRRVPEPTTLFAGWRDPMRRSGLLMLGVVAMAGGLAAALILASWLGAQLGEDQLEAALQSPEALAEALTGVSLAGGFLLAGAVLGLVLAGLYFAIPLIMFGRAPTLTAFITSIKAVVANWLAFVGYLIALLAVVIGLVIIVLLVTSFLTLALGPVGAFIAQILLLLVAMLFQVLQAGAQYLAFSQIFGWSPGLEEEDAGDDDNVVI
ncbi:MAG: hypothetical protein EA419_04145 [Wenzhouxiangella sp.]|nr:MAG: hypothetical protein EA419_04145 [Wenzhouxiangella sp.]